MGRKFKLGVYKCVIDGKVMYFEGIPPAAVAMGNKKVHVRAVPGISRVKTGRERTMTALRDVFCGSNGARSSFWYR